MALPPLALLPAILLAAAPPAPAESAPFASLAELDAAMGEVEHGAAVEPFWARVQAARAMPLLFGETAVFLHRSRADKVEWRGDITTWDGAPETAGRRLGRSDVFTLRRTFPRGARLDYKIVETTATWMVDPLNPHRQLGGYGRNSEVRMPGWSPPAHAIRRPGVPAGTFGPAELVESRKLGYGVNVRVYTPVIPAGGPSRLPILYVTDGSDYWHEEMGSLPATLDNLIAERRIPPLVAVFVDAWDPMHQVNRREVEFVPNRDDPAKPIQACPYCEFLVEELAPRVEARLAVDPSRRGILGTSWGGFFAAYLALRHPERFPLVAIQSPAIGRQPWLLPAIAGAAAVPRRVAVDVGLFEPWALPGARGLRDAYRARGATVHHDELPDGHSWGHWRAAVAPMLEFLYAER
ncbi:MAG: esterase family protein [Deltaproteobacteria bacterium]|nr:esterase family protein [Deltaproteobacteria bacterium]